MSLSEPHFNNKTVAEEKPTYAFATIGSITERGGRVTHVTTKAEFKGKALARVGDTVTYDDGTEATIVDGAGFAASWGGKPLALVGSRLSNGDRITESTQTVWGIVVQHGESILGLFDSTYTVAPMHDNHKGNSHA